MHASEPEPSSAEDHRSTRPLVGFLLLYAALYGGYGALSPFLPSFLSERGLTPWQLATLLASLMVIRLAAGPVIGLISDRTGARRRVLSLSLDCAAVFTLGFQFGFGPWVLLLIVPAQAISTAALAPLADTLAVTAARDVRSFSYGTVRAAGSAAFIAATLATGALVDAFGDSAGLWLCAACFLIAGRIALRVEDNSSARAPADWSGLGDLVFNGRFWRIVASAALVMGAHAMHDAFAIIAWRQAGISAATASRLWSISVAAEILVFLLLGPWLLARIGPAMGVGLAALAGAVRWAVQAETSWLPALALNQCLHGLTFALLHLASLALIVATVPAALRATALATYASLGLGLVTAGLTLLSGYLFQRFGVQAFLAMSLLSLAALPLSATLRTRRG